MFKNWLVLHNYPILGQSGRRLRLLQLKFLWLALRKPTHVKLSGMEFIQESEGIVWANFNMWLKFQLKHVNSRYWATSPLIRAVALVNLDESYEEDTKYMSRENKQIIEKISLRYTRVFRDISPLQFNNWITRNFLLVNAFSDSGVSPLKDTKYLVEIGPGLGAIISLALESNCERAYSFDTFEMQSTFSAITREFPSEYSRLENVTINDLTIKKPFKSPKDKTTVLAFWSFTETKEEERSNYFELFKEAERIILGTNEKFEGIRNFEYIEDMARQLEMNFVWKGLDDVFETDVPMYQKRHRIYLLQKK